MNRRNFFGTVGAAIVSAVLGSKVAPTANVEFVNGGRNLAVSSAGLRLFNADPLYARQFVADELRDNFGTVFYPNDVGEIVHLRRYGQTFTDIKGYAYVPTKEGGRDYSIYWGPDGSVIDPSDPNVLPLSFYWNAITHPDWYGVWL